ncbi:hypothetical protein RHSP_22813 [Rhizobium freirei PRF 81]|uniref:Uncharacterized protein n=1 Tax=Rhizobium freirei PRF 81 TaxID=363754 RepID=N6URR5_9HYPH|nr:hypothetical protein [Rhizobium freirei]ENN84405.1 hypothetical protein RHSP_22813 [Rhizobium freirei PRF 81]
MLLPAVGAVSAVSVSVEKPVVATAETSGLQTAATPLAVLSSAVNATVEGKLNMLLVAARERMLDSLLSAIDVAARVLNVSREPGESNAAYAQRVADAITNLTPQQLVAAQRQLDAQMSAPVPLPLLAAALADPESPQAVQLAFSLEQAAAAEPDAVLKAVVNSYGQNAGETKPAAAQLSASAPLQKTVDIAAEVASLTSPPKEAVAAATTQSAGAQPSAVPPGAPQSGIAPQPVPAPVSAATATPTQVLAQNGAAPTPQAVLASSGMSAVPPSQLVASLAEDLAAAPLLAAIATEAKLPIEIELIRSPLTLPPVPRDIQQIQAAIREGLQVVIKPPVMAVSSDLQQIINNPTASVEKIIAQALTANAAGQTPPQPAVDESSRSRLIPAVAMPASPADEPETAASAAASSGKPQVLAASAAAMAVYDTAEQAGMPVSVPLGVPFVVANYLPAASPTKAGEQKRVDRVDPVDDEEGERPEDEETAQHQDQDEPRAEEPPAQMAEEVVDDVETEPVSSRIEAVPPEMAALPSPSLSDRQQDHAFDFYRRMVAWE